MTSVVRLLLHSISKLIPTRLQVIGTGFTAVLWHTDPRLFRVLSKASAEQGIDRWSIRRNVWWLRHIGRHKSYSELSFFDYAYGLPPKELEQHARHLNQYGIDAAAEICLVWTIARLLSHSQGTAAANWADKFKDLANELLEKVTKHEFVETQEDLLKKTTDLAAGAGKEALLSIKNLFDSMETPFFIISGTFLGAVREQSFITDDSDLDFGVFRQDFDLSRFLKAISESKDLMLIRRLPCVTQKQPFRMIKLVHNGKVDVDIFIHDLEAQKINHGTEIQNWANTPFHLAFHTLDGINVRGPANADLYLNENFGNWKTPDKMVNGILGTPNLHLKKCPLTVAFYLNQMLISQSHEPSKVKRMEALLIEQEIFTLEHGKPVWNATALRAKCQ